MATPIPKNAAPFSLNAVLTATRGRLSGPLDESALEVVGVGTDSRSARAGELFVALRGERFDGHEHLAAVAEKGVALALVEEDVRIPGLTTVRVESTLEALGRLASYHLARWRKEGGKRVVALTGSAGKTTTKRAIAALAEVRATGRVLATAGNLNNLVGVPMMVLALTPEIDVAILEMGTNAAGEIGALSRMVRPDVVLVTLIASAHSEGLGGIDGIAREKTAMFRELGPNGIALGNVDDARVALGLANCVAREHVGYGVSAEAEFRIVRREVGGLVDQTLEVRRADGSLVALKTPLLGEAGALATVAALATVESTWPGQPFRTAELDAALLPLATVDEGPGRMQPRALSDGVVVVDDSYNANPASCRSSIAAAAELAKGLGKSLVLVLGEMRELGADRESAHLELGDWAVASGARLLLTVGPEAARSAERAAHLGMVAHHAASSDLAAELAVELVAAQDLVLVKGSRGVRTERVIEALAARAKAAVGNASPQGVSS